MVLQLSKESKAIIDAIYTDVIVSNKSGRIIYANNSTEYWFNILAEQLIGKSVFDLESQGVFTPSITRRVLETNQKQTLLQTTHKGKKLLVTGDIVPNDNNDIKYIVCYSQDITELEKMKNYVKQVESELDEIKEKLKLLEVKPNEAHIVAQSKNVKQILFTMERVAKTDATVFFTGESGVGKTMFAKHVHTLSERKGEFISINCAAIPSSLIEAELFGYEAGSFTGASHKGKVGLVEQADGGTLFLDEIGELPSSVQAKLLMLIQEKAFYRAGDTKRKEVDFRLIAATNINLNEKIQDGHFREDLYFRLSVIQLTIPPLRERQDDLLKLILNFLDHYNKQYNEHKELTHDTIDYLLKYDWPGNVRELSNVIERLVLVVENQIVAPEQLPANIIQENTFTLAENTTLTLPEILHKTEKEVLKAARHKYQTTTEIAQYLGVSQPTIVRKLKKYSL